MLNFSKNEIMPFSSLLFDRIFFFFFFFFFLMKRRRRSRDDEEEGGGTTPVQDVDDGIKNRKKKKKRVGRRVAFSEEPDDVLEFDKRDPVGTDFNALFAADTTSDSVDSESAELQPLDTSSDIQTTPQKFSLHEFVTLSQNPNCWVCCCYDDKPLTGLEDRWKYKWIQIQCPTVSCVML